MGGGGGGYSNRTRTFDATLPVAGNTRGAMLGVGAARLPESAFNVSTVVYV